MEITTRKMKGNYDGREVPYIELEVIGDRHTLSVRKYPKNTSVLMWKNSDKRNTKISMKMPHNAFAFWAHIQEIVSNFDTDLDDMTIEILEAKWIGATKSASF